METLSQPLTGKDLKLKMSLDHKCGIEQLTVIWRPKDGGLIKLTASDWKAQRASRFEGTDPPNMPVDYSNPRAGRTDCVIFQSGFLMQNLFHKKKIKHRRSRRISRGGCFSKQQYPSHKGKSLKLSNSKCFWKYQLTNMPCFDVP